MKVGAKRLRALLVVVGVVVCLVAGRASALPSATSCADATGAPFDFSVQKAHYAGDKYRVTATNVDCSFARTWVTKLTRSAPSKPHAVRSHAISGPQGWKCAGAGTPASGRSSPTITGTCSVGSTASPSMQFHWNIDVGQANVPPVVNAG
jgi:hypothetical protein